jgi:predicted metal-dependent peptidase
MTWSDMTDIERVRRLKNARTLLLLNHAFFGALIFRLKAVQSRSVSTMATDGKLLFINPEFLETLAPEHLIGCLAHEVMHPALNHHTRRGDRDPKLWNMACDYVINPILKDAGLMLPEGVLSDRRFRNMSAEQIYNILEQEQEQKNSQSNSGSQQSSGSGSQKQQPSGAGSSGQQQQQAGSNAPKGNPSPNDNSTQAQQPGGPRQTRKSPVNRCPMPSAQPKKLIGKPRCIRPL